MLPIIIGILAALVLPSRGFSDLLPVGGDARVRLIARLWMGVRDSLLVLSSAWDRNAPRCSQRLNGWSRNF